MPDERRRHHPLVVECTVFLAFGAPIGMLGAGWPEARHLFHSSTGSLGLVAGAYGLGRLVTATSALPILRRWHVREATAVLATVLALSGVAVALTRSFAVLVAVFAVIGLVSGCLDALGNRYQTVVRNVGSAGLMFGAFGVGATLGPILVAIAGWTPAFLASAGVAAVAALLAVPRAVRWPAAIDEAEPPHGDHSRIQVPRWVVALSLSLFGIYCGMEVTTGNWGASYLEGHRGVSGSAAAWSMSGFWAGMTLGRLGLGLVTGPGRPFSARQVLVGSGVLATVVYVGIPLAPVPVAIGLISVAGLALAAMFPTLMSTTADRVGVGAAGRVMGWQLLSANVMELGLSAVVGIWVSLTGPGAPAIALAVMSIIGLPLLVKSASLHAADGTVSIDLGGAGAADARPSAEPRSA
ncbi:MFS transporter [Aquihabitans sp. McL0605]|uniref:MFS transporter n=1 Tax=Aquihabitans sp. McL0605 TaxID=3415671 RepID=UPI003CEF09B3